MLSDTHFPPSSPSPSPKVGRRGKRTFLLSFLSQNWERKGPGIGEGLLSDTHFPPSSPSPSPKVGRRGKRTDYVEARPFPEDMALRMAEVIREIHGLPYFPQVVSYFDAIDGFIRRFQAARILPEREMEELLHLRQALDAMRSPRFAEAVARVESSSVGVTRRYYSQGSAFTIGSPAAGVWCETIQLPNKAFLTTISGYNANDLDTISIVLSSYPHKG